MSLDPMTIAFPSRHVTDVPLRKLSTESTLREEFLGSPFTSVTDDLNLPAGPQVCVLGLFRM